MSDRTHARTHARTHTHRHLTSLWLFTLFITSARSSFSIHKVMPQQPNNKFRQNKLDVRAETILFLLGVKYKFLSEKQWMSMKLISKRITKPPEAQQDYSGENINDIDCEMYLHNICVVVSVNNMTFYTGNEVTS